MTQTKPFKRTARPYPDGSYNVGGKGGYVAYENYAKDGRRYIRAALLLQDDLLKLFEYIEPTKSNFKCYSFRVHELLMRTSIEIEANFKAVLGENGYSKKGVWNIVDYQKIEKTHLLSKYRVKVPDLVDPKLSFAPFARWAKGESLPWYRAYNATKHDRHREFAQANLGNLLHAMGGLFVVLASQFHTASLTLGPSYFIASGGETDGFRSVAGKRFRVKFPDNVRLKDRYSFKDSDLVDDPSSFQSHNYS